MAQQQSGIFYLQNTAGNAGEGFPQELRSILRERVEPRFTILFLVSFILIGGAVFLLSFRKVSDVTSERDILQIQERYASIVLNQPKPKAVEPEKVNNIPTTTTKEEVVKPEEKKVNREKETYTQREERRTETTVSRQVARAQVQQQVQSLGIFAAITAVGPGAGRGSGSGAGGVSDLLGADGEGLGDLSNIKVNKGTFASKNADLSINDIKARRGGVTSGVDIGYGDVGKTSVTRIASAGSVRITSAPPVASGSSAALASRTMSSIQRVIDLEKNRLKRVFETWLKRDPTLNGQIKIKFTILPSGEVSNVSIVSSSTNNAEFDETIVRYIKRWMFDAVEGGGPVEITCPFAFEGQG